MRHGIPLTVLALAGALALSGCGKKPGLVDSPEGQNRPFPQQYPNPSLDTKPGQPAPGVQFP